jgi:hypothetical protein
MNAMSRMKRRHFLQFAGSALTAMGLSQTGFLRQADRYGKVLAQSTPRKLALLIGVNQYEDSRISNLSGCIKDVEMQYQLLVHRFGFNPSDILMLTDDEALTPTRDNILQAFQEHLIQQARPGDIVVVHYSGHGSQVIDPNPITVSQCGVNSNPNGLNGTLVPRDAMPERVRDSEVIVTDIMGRSLFLLMERIQTENLTVVLDSCFSGSGTRGNARVRSTNEARLDGRGDGLQLSPSPAELGNQARWMRELNLDDSEFHRRRSLGIAKGVAIGSASCDQLAYEQPYDRGQTAGTFSYLLTNYLWQTPIAEPANTVKVNLVRSTRVFTRDRGEQIPIFEEAPDSNNLAEPLYFQPPQQPFADGVVTNVTGAQIEIWMGGTSSALLETVQPGAIYSLLNPTTGELVGDIGLQSRNGLYAYGELLEGQSIDVQAGMLVREKLKALPNPTLQIGVDPTLAAEQVAAETALQTVLQTTSGEQTVNRINVLPVDQQSNLEYVLARTTEAMQEQLRQAGETDLPPIGSVGLYAADLSGIVPNTAGSVNESATAAVNRLQPRFKSLLVTRVLQELASTESSLQVNGTIYTDSGRGPSIPIVSRNAQPSTSSGIQVGLTSATYQTDELIEMEITNSEPEAVYLSSLVIDSQGNIVVLHPARWDAPDEAARIDSDESIVVPRAEDGVQFRLSGSGFIEVLTIVSQQPLRSLLRNLQAIASRGGRDRGAVLFDEGDPLDLVTDLLGDMDSLSRSTGTVSVEAVSEEDTAVDSGAIAVFSTLIEIVE